MDYLDYTIEQIHRIDTYNFSQTHGMECIDCQQLLTPEELRYCKDLHLDYSCSECLELELN
jgi:hypothetical protein